jgi:alpha-galactosidase
MNLANMSAGWGVPIAAKSIEGKPLTLNGVVYQHGVGTHAESEMVVNLKGSAVKFISMVGLDDERTGHGSVVFEVYVDGRKKADSGVMHGGDTAKLISVDLTGAKSMALVVTDAGDGIDCDHGDWAGAAIILAQGATARPESSVDIDETPMRIASSSSRIPAIHGPRVTGATPGRPFLFLVPATGDGPLTFSAKNLPDGLQLDPNTGIISGSLTKAGRTIVDLKVKGPRGSAARKLMIVGGNGKLALTPPMGWNSWYVWFGVVDAEKLRQAADWMVKTGLAGHGYQYINIDDSWEAGRDANGEIQTNDRLPDMKALVDYIHSKGLKFGIYSSPGPTTCGGYEGSYRHELQDAMTYAKWGVDLLKYDWCSYGNIARDSSLPELQKPYSVMRMAMDGCGRDMVYSLCQYGMGEVWKWGADVGGNMWRTTGDINDSWGPMAGNGFVHDGYEKYVGPGHWNDPDMIQAGKLGGPNLHSSKLSPNAQITQMTLWSLIAAPLLISCDLSQTDQFTIDLLSNDEVLDVDQDPLGRAAGRRARDDQLEVWSRPLWDGTTAVGLFNRSRVKTKVTAKWSDLGITGSQPVRDLWRRKDLGVFDGEFSASIPAHGAVLIKIGEPNRTDWEE